MHTHTVWGHCIQMCNLKSLHTHTIWGHHPHRCAVWGHFMHTCTAGVIAHTHAKRESLHSHMHSLGSLHTCAVLGVTAYTQMCTLGVTARPHAQQCCTIPELHVPSPTCCVCTPCSTVSACKQLPALQAASCTMCMLLCTQHASSRQLPPSGCSLQCACTQLHPELAACLQPPAPPCSPQHPSAASSTTLQPPRPPCSPQPSPCSPPHLPAALLTSPSCPWPG